MPLGRKPTLFFGRNEKKKKTTVRIFFQGHKRARQISARGVHFFFVSFVHFEFWSVFRNSWFVPYRLIDVESIGNSCDRKFEQLPCENMPVIGMVILTFFLVFYDNPLSSSGGMDLENYSHSHGPLVMTSSALINPHTVHTSAELENTSFLVYWV